ncbi:MAG: hypothetical protein OEV44_14670, partial [Spirochaetota bacterium]|nr:hypothetical protein [Spirochaetota bacterium]
VVLILTCLTFAMCEGEGSCTGNAPADHTMAVEHGSCRHKTGLQTPLVSGCWNGGCHKTAEAFSAGSAPSCYKCHLQMWVE